MPVMLSSPLRSRALRTLAALAAIAIPLALFVLGAQPSAANAVPAPWDKLAHVAVFSVLAGTIGVASGLRGSRMVMLSVVSAVFVGALDELHQIYLPGRAAGWDDFAADLAGAMLGAIAVVLNGRNAALAST